MWGAGGRNASVGLWWQQHTGVWGLAVEGLGGMTFPALSFISSLASQLKGQDATPSPRNSLFSFVNTYLRRMQSLMPLLKIFGQNRFSKTVLEMLNLVVVYLGEGVTSALLFFPLRQSRSSVSTDRCSSLSFLLLHFEEPINNPTGSSFPGRWPHRKTGIPYRRAGNSIFTREFRLKIKREDLHRTRGLKLNLYILLSPAALRVGKAATHAKRRLLVLAAPGGLCPAAVSTAEQQALGFMSMH